MSDINPYQIPAPISEPDHENSHSDDSEWRNGMRRQGWAFRMVYEGTLAIGFSFVTGPILGMFARWCGQEFLSDLTPVFGLPIFSVGCGLLLIGHVGCIRVPVTSGARPAALVLAACTLLSCGVIGLLTVQGFIESRNLIHSVESLLAIPFAYFVLVGVPLTGTLAFFLFTRQLNQACGHEKLKKQAESDARFVVGFGLLCGLHWVLTPSFHGPTDESGTIQGILIFFRLSLVAMAVVVAVQYATLARRTASALEQVDAPKSDESVGTTSDR